MKLRMLWLAVLIAPACTDHYSTQEAYAVCEDLTNVIITTGDELFAECVACYEDCGDECEQTGEGDESFVCPD